MIFRVVQAFTPGHAVRGFLCRMLRTLFGSVSFTLAVVLLSECHDLPPLRGSGSRAMLQLTRHQCSSHCGKGRLAHGASGDGHPLTTLDAPKK